MLYKKWWNLMAVMHKSKNLGRRVFILIVLLSFIPSLLIGFVSIQNMQKRLLELESSQKQLLLKSQVSPIASRVEVYKELIKFTSQLPAAVEILGYGQEYEGSIDTVLQSRKRYAGVINRAFSKYPELTDVRLYDPEGREAFHVSRRGESNEMQYERNYVHRAQFYREYTSGLSSDEVTVSIFVLLQETIDEGRSYDDLVLEMYSPVISSGEIVGIFIANINVSILSDSYPDIEWVLGNGEFLNQISAHDSAFRVFPGLEDIFASGEAGISHNEDYYSWIPLFSDGMDNVLLWAGKEIQFAGLERYYFLTYIIILGSLGFVLLAVIILGHLLVKRLRSYYDRVYSYIEKRLIEENSYAPVPLAGYKEIDDFIISLEKIIQKNSDIRNENVKLIEDLKKALNNVKELKELLPVCSSCKKVRDDDGYWEHLDIYLSKNTDTTISHGLCPDCARKLYPEYQKTIDRAGRKNDSNDEKENLP